MNNQSIFKQRKVIPHLIAGVPGHRSSSTPGRFRDPWGVTFNPHTHEIIVSDEGNHRLQYFIRGPTRTRTHTHTMTMMTMMHHEERDGESDDGMSSDAGSNASYESLNQLAYHPHHRHARDGDRDNHPSDANSNANAVAGDDMINATTRTPIEVAVDKASTTTTTTTASTEATRAKEETKETIIHVRCIGSDGQKLGQFNNPGGLCVQPYTHNLVVADTFNHRLQVLSSSNDLIQSQQQQSQQQSQQPPHPIFAIGGITKESSKDGHFNFPHSVCCASNGHIVAADTYNYRIQVFDVAGRFLRKFGQQGLRAQDLQYPWDVTLLQHRHCSPSSSALSLSPSLSSLAPSPSPPSLSSLSLAASSSASSPCPSSLLVVADKENKRLSLWTEDASQRIHNIQLKSYPRGLCVDLNGFICISTESRTVEIRDPRNGFALLQVLGKVASSSDRSSRRTVHAGDFIFPTAMCVDDTNALMVVDYGNNCVQFFA